MNFVYCKRKYSLYAVKYPAVEDIALDYCRGPFPGEPPTLQRDRAESSFSRSLREFFPDTVDCENHLFLDRDEFLANTGDTP